MTDLAAEKTGLQVASAPAIEKRIYLIRGRQVMLDEDLADLYGVETRVLVQQTKREALPGGLHVPADQTRGGSFEITNCDFKQGSGRTPLRAIRLHGAGRGHALQKRLDQMELDIGARLSEHDEQLRQIFEALRQLIAPPSSTKRPIGFRVREGDE
jgi:hypothetical protein